MEPPAPELLVAVYEDDARAARAERELAAAEEQGLVAMPAVAVLARGADGRARWSVRGAGVGHLAGRAETIATMIGVLLPSDLVVGGLLVAADAGGDEESRAAFADRFARELSEALAPGTSAFVAVVEDRWGAEIARGLRGFQRLTRRSAAPS